MRAAWSIILLGALAWLQGAVAADDAGAERARIRAERAQAQARYTAAERECNTRFVVTSCIEAARAERRKTLNELRRQELVLDQAERRRRAAERAASIRQRQAHDQAPRPPPRLVAPPGTSASQSGSRLHLHVPAAPTSAGHRPRLTPEEERRNREAFEQRQREAEAHREAVERRNAERAAKARKPSRPLPLPENASAPSR